METFAAIEKLNSIQNLSIEHFEKGEISLNDILEEVNYLKSQITTIRQEMATFLTGLATIQPDSKPQQVYDENIKRVSTLQKTLEDYVERFKKLTPLLELVNKDLEVKVPEKQASSIEPIPVVTPTVPKKAPIKKRTYNKKNSTGNGSSGNNAGTPQFQMPPRGQFQGDFNTGTENQPIML